MNTTAILAVLGLASMVVGCSAEAPAPEEKGETNSAINRGGEDPALRESDRCERGRATGLEVVSFECTQAGVVATFAWTSAEAGNQFLDAAFNEKALFELDEQNGFQGGDLQRRSTTTAQLLLLPEQDYAWRINTIANGLGDKPSNWCPSVVGSFRTPACP